MILRKIDNNIEIAKSLCECNYMKMDNGKYHLLISGNRQLVTFTEEILNEKLRILCNVVQSRN